MAHHRGAVALVLGVCLLMAACSSSHPNTSQSSRSRRVRPTPPSNSTNIYAAAGKDMLSKHVVPSWDHKTLYVTNDLANTLTPIDPMTGKPSGLDIAVDDPYNMYFTPDGARAIVVAEAQQRLDFRDPHTFALTKPVPVDCNGVDHADFSADGAYLIATCEFSGKLVKVDLRTETVVGYLEIGGSPQDIKLDPQGRIFYVAGAASGAGETSGSRWGAAAVGRAQHRSGSGSEPDCVPAACPAHRARPRRDPQ